MHPQLGRVAQLVQSTWFTPKGSGVRIPSRPLQNPPSQVGFFVSARDSNGPRTTWLLAAKGTLYLLRSLGPLRAHFKNPPCQVGFFVSTRDSNGPAPPGSSLQKVHCTFCLRSALFAPTVMFTFRCWVFVFFGIRTAPHHLAPRCQWDTVPFAMARPSSPTIKSTFPGWIFSFHLINKLPNRFLDSLLHERLL